VAAAPPSRNSLRITLRDGSVGAVSVGRAPAIHQPPPPATRTSRHRAYPHPTSRAEHPGHPNRPAANSDSYATTEPVPDTVNNGASVRHSTALPRTDVIPDMHRGRAVAQQVVCTLMTQTSHRNPHSNTCKISEGSQPLRLQPQ
jgi:predicted deacylase